jgi:hypothetical protein
MAEQAIDLEKSLERLLDTHLARLPEIKIPTRLVAGQWAREIQSTTRVDGFGTTFAADQYTFSFHPEDYQILGGYSLIEQEKFSKAFASIIRQAHYTMAHVPHIAFSTDPLLPRTQLRVIAWHSSDPVGTGEGLTSADADTEAFPKGAFLVVRGSEHFPLDKPVVNIGRRLDNHLVISDPQVSRKHAQIRAKSGRYYVIDLHSSSGTMLNGERIEEAGLKPGDVLTLATVELIYGEDVSGRPKVTPPYAPPFEEDAEAEETHTSELSTMEMDGKVKRLKK